jgi:uroporphyrinogen III methyltransferase/synthase
VSGFVSLVGAGPGDPALITLAAIRAIRESEAVLYDALVHPAVLDHAPTNTPKIFVGKRAGHEGTTQQQIHDLLLRYAREGLRVCRLKGGDPLLFGRGSEEAEFLAANGVAFEIVPGVSSFVGATAYAGISLTHRELASSVALVTSSEHAEKSASAHDWSKLATATQTLVLFMGARKLRGELERLVEFGRPATTPAAAIEWGTFARQRVITGTISDLADRCEAENLGPPALIVVGDVVSLRARLQWWNRAPLADRSIAILRPKDQAESLCEQLRRLGAETIVAPAIRIESVELSAESRAVLNALDQYNAVLFSSRNGVERFCQQLAEVELDWRALGRAKVVALGSSTAQVLRDNRLRPDVVALAANGEGLLRTTLGMLNDAPSNASKARVLFVRAQNGRDHVIDGLRAEGVEVDLFAPYRTTLAAENLQQLDALIERGSLDLVVLTSPSIVAALCESLGAEAAQKLAPVTVLAIGPTTRDACKNAGIRVDLVPDEPSDAHIAKSIEAHFRAAVKAAAGEND